MSEFRGDSLESRDAQSFLLKRCEQALRFDDRGLIPCIVQQQGSKEVLMMAWMNAESIMLSLKSGSTWFWSRSRNELWNKGATSGNTQNLLELRYDCDADCLLAIVDSPGPACHTGERSCFYRSFLMDDLD